MREIALDTETTGLSIAAGDRITEIGCVEIVDKKITGRTFHTYINPEREVSHEAFKISGLTNDFLKQHRIFKDVYQEFLNFIRQDRLIIHNAQFDISFLNAELTNAGGDPINDRNIVDTLILAREKYPGSPSSLDALCRRFDIDASNRVKHGALIDAGLLAQVYIVMSVEILQRGFFKPEVKETKICEIKKFEVRKFALKEEERAAHNDLLKKLNNPIWCMYENLNIGK
ncbi:MAG: DNA polymerase III subunit epsilon [Holosporales bacterium]|jgi:DNA polymerase-3 subunit epsilon|nr:DNA polymerase III subunit epsilon [Holosporales bacterium]